MTEPIENERALARRILHCALDDLRLESLRIGRGELFDALLPALLDPARKAEEIAFGTHSVGEIRIALLRLRKRLQERVNARLRQEEPDAARRQALRRRLHSSQSRTGGSP